MTEQGRLSRATVAVVAVALIMLALAAVLALALPGGKPDAGGGATGANALGAEDVIRDPSVPYALYEAPDGTGGWVVLDKATNVEYLLVRGDGGGIALTPRPGADGDVMVMPQE